MKSEKRKAWLIFIGLSLVPLVIGVLLAYVLVLSQPVGFAGLGSIMLYLLIVIVGFPVFLFGPIVAYLLLERRNKLVRISRKAFVIPVITAILASSFYFIFAYSVTSLSSVLYESNFSGFDPSVRLVSEEIIENPRGYINWKPVTYKYTLEINNPVDKEFRPVSLNVGIKRERADDVQYINTLSPGKNIVSGEMNFDEYDFTQHKIADAPALHYQFRTEATYREPGSVEIGTETIQKLKAVQDQLTKP